jgi:hypothetical protein
MPIQFHKFDQQKIDNIKTTLDSFATKGEPRTYEIAVDGIKAVIKTEDPNEFYKYEDYMTENTSEIRIKVYSGSSPRNDQYSFAMKAKTEKEALDHGLDGFSSKSYSESEVKEMAAQRQKQNAELEELALLRLKVVEQEAKIKENLDLVATMQKIIDKAKENGNKIGGVHLGDLLSMALEGFVKRNAPAIAKATGFEGFAGAFSNEGNTEQSQENNEASFKKKQSSNETNLSEHEKEFIILFHELEKVFNQDEMLQVISVLQMLSKDKSQLTPVVQLLEE